MSVEETKQVVEGFVESQDGCWLAETVQLSSPVRVVASGRDSVREALAPLYGMSQIDERSIETRIVVADGIAAVEVVRPQHHDQLRPGGFAVGPHTGPITGACFYDVVGGEIVRASVHFTPTEEDETNRGPAGAPHPGPEQIGAKT